MSSPATAKDILAIDDTPANLSVLSDMLREYGYRVRVANSGRRGLEAAQQAKPDLVMLDISMPEMDGFEVCRALKADPDLADVPVIFISALEEVIDKARAFAVGGADYVQKPFQVEEVLLRVTHHLRLATLQNLLREKNQSLEAALEEAKVLNREFVRINERLRVSEELQSHFLATMRSEINNPLNAIMGLAAQIHGGGLPLDRARELASFIESEAKHLDFQIRNIFAAADLEAGTAVPTLSQVDVASILTNLLDSFSGALAAKSLKVRLVPPPEAEALPFGTDAGMLRIILANLLANAIEFSPAGGEILLETRLEGDELSLSIQDAGIGIREEDQSLIFDRFRQLEQGASRVHQGPGLGLAVTRALVELMQGTIEVQSQPGAGARFSCRFPRLHVMDEANTSSFEGNVFIFDAPKDL
jgi:signal transduction histidine kinase